MQDWNLGLTGEDIRAGGEIEFVIKMTRNDAKGSSISDSFAAEFCIMNKKRKTCFEF